MTLRSIMCLIARFTFLLCLLGLGFLEKVTAATTYSVSVTAATVSDDTCAALGTEPGICQPIGGNPASSASASHAIKVKMCDGPDDDAKCQEQGSLTTADFGGDGVVVDCGSMKPQYIKLSNDDTDGWLIGNLEVTLVSTEDGGNADTKTYDLKWATPAVIDGTPFDQIGWGGFKVFAELVVPLIDCDDKPPKDQSSSIHIELQTGEESWARTSYPVYITFYAGPETDAQRKTEMLFESVEKSTSVVRDYSLSFTPRMIDLRASSTNGAKIDVFAMSVNGVEIDLSWAFPILIDGRPYGSTVDPQTGVGYTLAATNVHILSLNQCDLPALVYMPCLGVAWECPESGVVDVYTNVQCASGLDQGSYLQFSQGQVTYGCIDQSDASATASADGGKKNYAFDDIVPAVGVDTCYFFAAASAKCNEDGSECSGDCVDIFGGKAKYDNIPQGYVDIAGTSWGKSTADNHYELKVGDATLQFGSQLSCADVGSTLSSAELVNKLLNDLPWQKSCEAYGLDAPSRFKGSSDSSDCDQSNGGLIAAVIIPWLIIAGAGGYLGYIYWQKRKYGGGKPYTTGLDDIDMLHEPMIPN